MDPDAAFKRTIRSLREHATAHRKLSGFVYFVGAYSPDGELEAIKIGWTRKRVDARVADLRTGNHRQLELLGCEIGNVGLEADLHEQYAELRGAGEWFSPASLLLEYIARLDAVGAWVRPIPKCEPCQLWASWLHS